ncbi:MAG TPA: hypothetical protein VMT88_09715 [Actinomycetes bacterium]|nr:hypothetical protein [Actinomycetes bacterium]
MPPSRGGVLQPAGGTTVFMQIIQGKVRDKDLLQSQVERWRTDVKPGAKGYLGTTSGFTPDGQYVVLVRFESEDSARANSDRPEQGTWWGQTAAAFDGEPTFIDCATVDTMFGGGSNEAGFVQVMHGRAKDQEAMRTAGRSMEDELRGMRPDILGGIVGWHGDRNFVQAMYFISEDTARKGEQEMSNDPQMDDWGQMLDGEITFLDLPEPEFD